MKGLFIKLAEKYPRTSLGIMEAEGWVKYNKGNPIVTVLGIKALKKKGRR